MLNNVLRELRQCNSHPFLPTLICHQLNKGLQKVPIYLPKPVTGPLHGKRNQAGMISNLDILTSSLGLFKWTPNAAASVLKVVVREFNANLEKAVNCESKD